jgi:hypothetical protein
MYKRLEAAGLVAVALLLAACEVQKSEHPLSPSVAGPIPGVNITAPGSSEPASGSRFLVSQQPVTLSVGNASTNGVRPLSYLFEVATDAQFANKVFSQAGITPGNGKTSLTLPALATEKTYYWHALAQDGANTGTFTPTASFSIYTPVVIGAPVPVSPIGGIVVTSLTPTLIVQNAPRSGPAAPISNMIAVNFDRSFGKNTIVGVWVLPEDASGSTSFQLPTGFLTAGVQYYWAVWAGDGTNSGEWSPIQTFVAPAPTPAPTPGGGGGGTGGSGGGGGAATDFDGLGPVQIIGGSPDVRSWPVTSRITSLRFSPGNIHLEHTKLGQWPGVDIGGALQESTLWVFFKIGGLWYATGGERWRPGQTDKALSAPSAIGPGWFYNGNWAPMTNYVPRPGEQVGFMVVAGSTRADSRAPVRERSNVLMVPFPADGVSASFP